MIRVCQQNQKYVLDKVRAGQVDMATLSTTSFVDKIILQMSKQGILRCIKQAIPDKRAHNTTIPFDLVLALSIAAKMKIRTSLTDVPYAITDHRTLAELGYSLVDDEGKLGEGLLREGSLRHLLGKYQDSDLFKYYSKAVQEYIMPKLDIVPNIHILDCTKIEVNFDNTNYEKAGIVSEGGERTRGYKLSTLRGITGDSGIIEDVRFGSINTYDLELSREMLFNSPVLKAGDVLIEDRGFLSRETINKLKNERLVDTYIPLRKNMEAYRLAISIAKDNNQWEEHPVEKRKKYEKITFVSDVGSEWTVKGIENNVQLNACVVWDQEIDTYHVFVTTDITKSAKDIVKMYELRPEIEEDYRQLKDFWKLEDFKSTKINVIAFHIVCVLFGYLFFKLFIMSTDGEAYAGRSLPIILKYFEAKVMSAIVFYIESYYGIFSLMEVIKIYHESRGEIKLKLEKLLDNM